MTRNRSGLYVATEHQEQVALIQWARAQAYVKGRESLNLLFAIPNGAQRVGGAGGRLKAEGVQAGVPDLCLPFPVAPYHGAWVELKSMGGRPTTYQVAWARELRANGYAMEFCYGWPAARDFLAAYLEGRYLFAGDGERAPR